TLLTLLRMLLGEPSREDATPGYSGGIEIRTLTMRHLDTNAAADLADLKGKRLIVSNEYGVGQVLQSARIKGLTQGNAYYKVARKYENPVEFWQTWKIWLDTNYTVGF